MGQKRVLFVKKIPKVAFLTAIYGDKVGFFSVLGSGELPPRRKHRKWNVHIKREGGVTE